MLLSVNTTWATLNTLHHLPWFNSISSPVHYGLSAGYRYQRQHKCVTASLVWFLPPMWGNTTNTAASITFGFCVWLCYGYFALFCPDCATCSILFIPRCLSPVSWHVYNYVLSIQSFSYWKMLQVYEELLICYSVLSPLCVSVIYFNIYCFIMVIQDILDVFIRCS